MGVTIKDVADKAGVSIATVSHTINKTRYVSPELAELVNKAIEETGYLVKLSSKKNGLMLGKRSVVAMVVPNFKSTIFSSMASLLSKRFSDEGYLLGLYVSNDDISCERSILMGLSTNKRVGGIILAPVSDKPGEYDKLFRTKIPFVCLARDFGGAKCASFTAENRRGMYTATNYLIKSGHSSIALLLDSQMQTAMRERLDGYKCALSDAAVPYNEKLVMRVDSADTPDDAFAAAFHRFYEIYRPTAVIAGGNKLTYMLLRAMHNTGLDCPRDISMIGYGDEEWCSLTVPPLTVLCQDTEKMANLAADELLGEMNGEKPNTDKVEVPVNFSIRKSTVMIGRGPFGEQAHVPEDIVITPEEKHKLREGNFKVGISFHYSGNAWTHLHENAIRNTLENFGVSVISVTDAHFDPSLQLTQLEGLTMQKPDAIIAIPVDDKVTSDKFRKIAKRTKLIFMSNVPEGLKSSEYCTCVSVNESENGTNIANMIGGYYGGQPGVKIGFITHGIPFYGTHLRDLACRRTINDQYPNIEIAANGEFITMDRAYDVCREMVERNRDLRALYISWERPALEAIRALHDIGREDVSIFTTDLDLEIGKYLAADRMVRGISSQRPYEQGIAVAMATAKALVGGESYKYVAVDPYSVRREGLLRAWKDIMHEEAPMSIERAYDKII